MKKFVGMFFILLALSVCYSMPEKQILNDEWLEYCDSGGQAHLGFIIIVDSNSENLDWILQHERIHLEQQKETGIIGFYIIYAFDYLRNLTVYGNSNIAYKNVIFEKEAKKYERFKDDRRSLFRWLREAKGGKDDGKEESILL